MKLQNDSCGLSQIDSLHQGSVLNVFSSQRCTSPEDQRGEYLHEKDYCSSAE